MKLHRLLIGALIAVSLSACMGVKFTYNNLDWLLPWYVEDYITLTDIQEEQFEQEFEDLWAWHRENELPKYVTSLKQLEEDIAEDAITLEKIIAYQDEARDHYLVTAQRVVSQGIDLMSTLSDEQVAEMKEIIMEEMAEYEERVFESSKEERIKKRIRNTEKSFRRWIGKLTNKQKILIEQWGSDLESLYEYGFQYTVASRKAFFAAMERREDKEYLRERLLFLTVERDQLHTKEHLEARERNRDKTRQLLLTMKDTLTKKQRERLIRKIKNYREPLEELAAEAESAS
ncbi:MAG: DUF6279 family lipoprotein [Gammaproteobacteria bacterium]